MSTLLAADGAIFLAINHFGAGYLADRLFLAITELGSATFAVGLTIVSLLVLYRRRAVRLIALGLLLVPPLAFCDIGLKRLIGRARPIVALGDAVRLVGPRLENWSFPSGHAFTAAAVLGYLWVVDRRLAWAWLPCTLLVMWSRVYLGVHYPSDVLAGAGLGFGLAYSLSRLLKLDQMSGAGNLK